MTMLIIVILICVANSIVTGNYQDYDVRLNNEFGNNSREGRLEIYYTGGWGTVCDDDFTNASARVACNSLGFGYMGVVIGNRYGAGVDPIWLDDVNCTGSEAGIDDCVHNAWGVNDCGHSEDVSISCDCTSRNFSQRTGKISSPNFPSQYANDLNCNNYIITAETGQKVIITFLAFDTEACCDSVTITCESGSNYTSPRYSGSEIPAVLTISSCTLVNVAFQTDGTVLSTGFSLTYNITSDCADRYFNGSSGQISSPNFPMAYTNHLDCSSYITVPSEHTVIITFLALDTEPAFDWVTIMCVSGNNYTSPVYSGSHIPSILTISSCSLIAVHFHTDRSDTNTGFTLTYNTTTDCGDRHFSGPTGQISSPNFPMAYSNNQDCSSFITVLTGQKITITFLAFNTESVNDWLTISCTSGVTYTSPRYSGSQIPSALIIYSCNQVKVYFHTDGSTTNTGFNLMYNITSDCGDRYFSEPTGQISSPNFPMAYSDNQDCSSYITVLVGLKITITFLAFNTESINDWVTISCTSGLAFTSPKYSGSEIPPVVTISSCNQVNVYFHTDSSTVYTGFNLTYNIDSDCADRYFNGSTGQISSPNFPMAYDNNLDCSSYITVPSRQTVVMSFLAFSTENSNDWVTITCESGNVFGTSRYWGADFPVILAIPSCNLVNVHFHTGGFTTSMYTGFSLTYNITSDIVSGGITVKPSNSFPRSDNDDPVIFNCTTSSKYFPWWTINAQSSSNYTITNSTCGLVTSAPNSSWFRTESLGPGSCNLIVTAPANNLHRLTGSFVCTDATLASARAIVAPINLELRSTKVVNYSTTVMDIVRDEELIISCNVSFTDIQSTPSLIFTYFLYNGGPSVQIRILRTYWTSQGNIVSSTDTSSASSYVQLKAPAGTIPRYTCNTVCDFFSNMSDIVGNSKLEISFSTEPVDVLYWPMEDKMAIIGDDNGQIRTPALLYCNVPANPPATFTWIDESNGNITNGPTATVFHGGKYTCNASNVIRGQNYQTSKSVNLQVLEDDTNRPNILAIILGSLFGAAVLVIMIILTFLFCRKCHRPKPNEASDVGRINHGDEHELHQKRESNSYETGFRHNVDLDESECANAGGIQRPASMYPDDYEELNIEK